MRNAFFVLTLASLGGCTAGAPIPESELASSLLHRDGMETIRVSSVPLTDDPSGLAEFDVTVQPAIGWAVIEPANRMLAAQIQMNRSRTQVDRKVMDRMFYEDVLFQAIGRECRITESIPRPPGMGYEFIYRC